MAGLELGADDYITKPFSLAVLRARVNTQLRRTAAPQAERVQLDGFTFDFGRMEFSRNGVPVELSKTEQKLLRLLVEHRGQTLTRAALVDRIWTDGAEYVDENALSVTVKRLRDKLEDMPSKPRYIKTVYGLGYTWAVNWHDSRIHPAGPGGSGPAGSGRIRRLDPPADPPDAGHSGQDAG